MAIHQHKSGDGSGGWVLKVYSDEVRSDFPILELIVRDDLYDALSAGEKTAVTDAIVHATADALAYGGS